ncbi:MAG: DUF1573 domain-containing protein [Planctomycetaceae bacterium]|nr:DUF1573 domain-containing protein [Planctomycetaceae bacterium]
MLASFVLCAGVLMFGFFRCGTVIYLKLQSPSLVRNGITYDFGTVSVGDNCTNEFEIRNTGGGDLVIHKVVASCGACVEITDYTKTPIPSGYCVFFAVRSVNGNLQKLPPFVVIMMGAMLNTFQNKL